LLVRHSSAGKKGGSTGTAREEEVHGDEKDAPLRLLPGAPKGLLREKQSVGARPDYVAIAWVGQS
jgi:hypothetical protein